MSASPDMSTALLRWYEQNRRDLPWRVRPDAPRGARPDAYHVLVSEAMLQQTQVATVIPYFLRFIEAFPSIQALADSDEQQVLRLWQGLGYYSRAKNLRRAAIEIVQNHHGVIPRDVETLLTLPGVGRYTAGAIASLAYDRRAPILDGNVARVLCRLECIEENPREKQVVDRLWSLATHVLPKRRVGDFNSAMMELGATVCVPRKPHCLICPVRQWCDAYRAGKQDEIPPPRTREPVPLLKRTTWCIERQGQFLIEQRPASGRWAGMWQFLTLPDQQRPSNVRKRRHLGTIEHGLTHRQYRFEVFHCQTAAAHEKWLTPQRRWVELSQLDQFPLPRPHLRIAQLLRERGVESSQTE